MMARGAIRSSIIDLAPSLIYLLMRGLNRTIRWTEVNNYLPGSFWSAGLFVILAFWHGRMLMSPFFYRGRGLKILISHHSDGEFICRVMNRFGFDSVRGSTRRGGIEAFRELVRTCQQGLDVVITPDGPRGPRYVVQKGVIELARRTGLPIVPLSYSAYHRIHCRSWDEFLIPRPFTRGVIIYGHPLWVDPKAGASEREVYRQQLERRLRRLTEQADTFFEYQVCGFPI